MDTMDLFGNSVSEKKHLIYYDGELGVFDYDPDEFEIIYITVVRVFLSVCLKAVKTHVSCLLDASFRKDSILEKVLTQVK